MLVKCSVNPLEIENISHSVTLVPRLEYSVNLLDEIIDTLEDKQSELKESLRGRMARYLPIGGIISFASLGLLLITLSEDSAGFSGYFGSEELQYVTQESAYVN